jgi:predicted transcriptional regulator
MLRTFKVEFRTFCKMCPNPITHKRSRTYCSKQCRIRANTIKNKEYRAKNKEYRAKWQLARYDKQATINDGRKIQCLICKKWYIQICSHAFLRHKITAREYKTEFGLDVKRGKVPDWYRRVKSEITLNNGTIANLEVGKKFWFTKGSETAGRYTRSQETLDRLTILGKRTIRTNTKHK